MESDIVKLRENLKQKKTELVKLEPVLDEKKFRKLISELPKILDDKWAQAS